MFTIGFISRHNNHYLPLRLMLPVPRRHLGQSPPPMLFVNLRDLPRDRAMAVRTKVLRELLQSLDKPVWRLIEHHRSRLCRKLFKQGLPALFHRQEPLKTKPVARKTGRDNGGNTCRSPRKRLNLNTLLRTSTNQKKTGIGYSRSTCIAYQGDIQPGQDTLLYELNRLVLIELVVRP